MVNFFLFRTTTTVVLVLLFTSPEAERVTIDSPLRIRSHRRPETGCECQAIRLHINDEQATGCTQPRGDLCFMAMASIPGTNIGGGADVRASTWLDRKTARENLPT